MYVVSPLAAASAVASSTARGGAKSGWPTHSAALTVSPRDFMSEVCEKIATVLEVATPATSGLTAYRARGNGPVDAMRAAARRVCVVGSP